MREWFFVPLIDLNQRPVFREDQFRDMVWQYMRRSIRNGYVNPVSFPHSSDGTELHGLIRSTGLRTGRRCACSHGPLQDWRSRVGRNDLRLVLAMHPPSSRLCSLFPLNAQTASASASAPSLSINPFVPCINCMLYLELFFGEERKDSFSPFFKQNVCICNIPEVEHVQLFSLSP